MSTLRSHIHAPQASSHPRSIKSLARPVPQVTCAQPLHCLPFLAMKVTSASVSQHHVLNVLLDTTAQREVKSLFCVPRESNLRRANLSAMTALMDILASIKFQPKPSVPPDSTE